MSTQGVADTFFHNPQNIAQILFSELDEIRGMMSSAWEKVEDERKEEQLLERWKYLFDLYQEQPHLIDPHLTSILGKYAT